VFVFGTKYPLESSSAVDRSFSGSTSSSSSTFSSVSVCPESVGTGLWVSPEVPLTGSSFIRSSLEAVAVEEGGGTELEGEKAVD
jgi:hypothetical protein